MVEILQETSVIPKDANYTLKEINEILDIVISITEKNKSLLRYEFVITSFINIIGDNLQKDDIREKVIKVATLNIVYQPRHNFKNYIKVYTNLINVLYDEKLYPEVLTILQHMSKALNLNRMHSNQYYVIFDKLFDKCKNIDDKNMEQFFMQVAVIVHSKHFNIALKIYNFYETKHSKSTDKKEIRKRILCILFRTLHYAFFEGNTKEVKDAIKIITEIKNKSKSKSVIKKANSSIDRIKKFVKQYEYMKKKGGK